MEMLLQGSKKHLHGNHFSLVKVVVAQMPLRSRAYDITLSKPILERLRLQMQGLSQAVQTAGHLYFLSSANESTYSSGFISLSVFETLSGLAQVHNVRGLWISHPPGPSPSLPHSPLTQPPCPSGLRLRCICHPHSVCPPGCGHAGGYFFHV